jgi:hypothetical protein
MTEKTIQALDWYLADSTLKAETPEGTYEISHGTTDIFRCRFTPYVQELPNESGFIQDAIQVCEHHFLNKPKNES